MLGCASPGVMEQPDAPSRDTLVTTLYDLIEAIQEVLEPGEEAWVTPIVMHLLRRGRMSCEGDLRDWAVATSSSEYDWSHLRFPIQTA
jgi:hypothetical protein